MFRQTIPIEQISIAKSQDHHVYQGHPLYHSRFKKVGKFHPPGLAPVEDNTGAFHIHISGKAAYARRFIECFGFYQGCASVKDDRGFFHIDPLGNDIYSARYAWCGNFQEDYCVVLGQKGEYFHIQYDGNPCYKARYYYAGDFHDGYAVVRNKEGQCFHIDAEGKPRYQMRFMDADVFHKGIARAKDKKGWFHIASDGHPLYKERYAAIDHFYNHIAHVETREGEKKLINLQGKTVRSLETSKVNYLPEISHDLVGFWRTQALALALHLKLFTLLPQTAKTLSRQLVITEASSLCLLKALWEMGYIKPLNSPLLCWGLTNKGNYLKQQPALIHEALAQVWGNHHYKAWHLENLLHLFSKDANGINHYFRKLAENSEMSMYYQQALIFYAKEDYAFIHQCIDWSKHKTIIDVGGGHGQLLQSVLDRYPQLEACLIDLPRVINSLPKKLKHKNCHYLGLDFFNAWGQEADAIVLAKVLHDWSDENAIKILQRAKEALLPQGRVYIIELILSENNAFGSLLNLNMFIMTRGKERTLNDWERLIHAAGFRLEHQQKGNLHLSCISLVHEEIK